MIVYDKEQKQIVIPNGLGNVNIIINQGCDDDKPVPPQDGWGMTGIFNNWGATPDIPFNENGEWDGRPYKAIRNFAATGGEFKIRRNNDSTYSYTASFHNEPQFAKLFKGNSNMLINDGVWDIYLFFGNDGEPNEMLILRSGTDLSTIQYEYTLTISTDKENAIIEIADSYRGMTDRYYGGSVTVTMKYGCIYYVNIYMDGYEDISDEITCYNDEQRNYTLTKKKYNTIADIYGLPADSTVTFKGLVALSFDYKGGKNILFTDHTGSIILKKCQEPLMVGDECLVTATLRRNTSTYISSLLNASVEVLSSNNYVVMPTDAVELTNPYNLYVPNEGGYAEMKYLYADGTVVGTPSPNLMQIETDATRPDNIALQGDFSDWVGKLVEGDNIRVYMFPESNSKYFWVTDIIKLDSCNLGSLSWTLDSPHTSLKNASDDGYDGYSQVIVSPENLIKQEKENAVNDFKKGMDEITITKNGTYSTEDQEILHSIAFDGNSYFDTGIVPTENIKIEVCIKITNGNDSGAGGIIIGGGIGPVGGSTENRGIAIGMGDGEIYGIWGAIKSEKEPYRFEGTTTVVLQKTNDSWVWGGEKGSFGASTLYIGGYNTNGTNVRRTFFQSIVYIKIWTNKDDDSTMTLFRPKNMAQGGFGMVNSEGTEYSYVENLGEGTATFVEEFVNKYPNGFKRVEVNVPDLNGSYDEGFNVGYNQGKTDGVNEQKSKLGSISITENGVYTKEDGYNHIEVNVPDLNGSYDEGYAKGQTDIAAKARVLNVTENGVYKSKFSDPIMPTTVTGVYADGTEFYDYAELNGKVFNTKIAGSVDSRLEFWYKGDNTVAGDGWNAIIGSGNNDNRDCFQVRYWDHNNDRLLIEIGNSGMNYYNWDDTVWHHLIISKAEGLWIDGKKEWNFKQPSNTINGEFLINGTGYNVNSNANGCFGMIKIDDTTIIPTANGFKNVNTGELLEVVKDGTYTFTENLPIYGEGELYKTIDVNVVPQVSIKEAGLNVWYNDLKRITDENNNINSDWGLALQGETIQNVFPGIAMTISGQAVAKPFFIDRVNGNSTSTKIGKLVSSANGTPSSCAVVVIGAFDCKNIQTVDLEAFKYMTDLCYIDGMNGLGESFTSPQTIDFTYCTNLFIKANNKEYISNFAESLFNLSAGNKNSINTSTLKFKSAVQERSGNADAIALMQSKGWTVEFV